jgi:hypothetical protein
MDFFLVVNGDKLVESINLAQVRRVTIEKREDGTSMAIFHFANPQQWETCCSHALDVKQTAALEARIGVKQKPFVAVINL